MRLGLFTSSLGLVFAALVQAGPLTTAGCPDAPLQVPTNQGFAAWRWAVGNWQMAEVDEKGAPIDLTQYHERIENVPNMIECTHKCNGNPECHGLNFFDVDKVCMLFKHPFTLTPTSIISRAAPFVGVAIRGSCAVDGKMVNDVNPVLECCNIWYP